MLQGKAPMIMARRLLTIEQELGKMKTAHKNVTASVTNVCFELRNNAKWIMKL